MSDINALKCEINTVLGSLSSATDQAKAVKWMKQAYGALELALKELNDRAVNSSVADIEAQLARSKLQADKLEAENIQLYRDLASKQLDLTNTSQRLKSKQREVIDAQHERAAICGQLYTLGYMLDGESKIVPLASTLEYRLVQTSHDWSDEFNVEGAFVTTAIQLEDELAKIKAAFEAKLIGPDDEFYFGTNQFLQFESYEALMEGVTITSCSKQFHDEFVALAEGYAGSSILDSVIDQVKHVSP